MGLERSFLWEAVLLDTPGAPKSAVKAASYTTALRCQSDLRIPKTRMLIAVAAEG